MIDPDAVAYSQTGPLGEGQSEIPTAPFMPHEVFPPDPTVQGPGLSETVEKLPQVERAGRILEAIALRDYIQRENDVWAPFTFDSNGMAKVSIYQAPQGNVSKITRICIDVQGFTPASPYVAAAAWAAIYRANVTGNALPFTTGAAAGEHDANVGAMIDFAPATAGSALFPGLFEYNEASCPRLRGPQAAVLFVFGTTALANKQGSAYVRAVDTVQL